MHRHRQAYLPVFLALLHETRILAAAVRACPTLGITHQSLAPRTMANGSGLLAAPAPLHLSTSTARPILSGAYTRTHRLTCLTVGNRSEIPRRRCAQLGVVALRISPAETRAVRQKRIFPAKAQEARASANALQSTRHTAGLTSLWCPRTNNTSHEQRLTRQPPPQPLKPNPKNRQPHPSTRDREARI